MHACRRSIKGRDSTVDCWWQIIVPPLSKFLWHFLLWYILNLIKMPQAHSTNLLVGKIIGMYLWEECSEDCTQHYSDWMADWSTNHDNCSRIFILTKCSVTCHHLHFESHHFRMKGDVIKNLRKKPWQISTPICRVLVGFKYTWIHAWILDSFICQ